MKYEDDKRIVMTLDAGGTNFVFAAIQGNKQIVNEIRLDSNGDDLERSLNNILTGFTLIKEKLNCEPAAISFGFPGPADYPNGVLGNLGNLTGYRGGVALGPMLTEKFGLPTFINNDGDLYAYGEDIAGLLPAINEKLESVGNPKRYNNLLGITLGTGLGAGIVRNGEMYLGDNSIGGEICLFRNKLSPNESVEEHASIRGVKRVYCELTGMKKEDAPSPKEIYEIAIGELKGNKEAAIDAYKQMAQVVGDAISNAITLLDGLVVMGGGLTGASSLFMPFIIEEMKSSFRISNREQTNRLLADVYNLDDEDDLKKFIKSQAKEIIVPLTNKKVIYDPSRKIGIGISRLGASKSISIGAYAFALKKLDEKHAITNIVTTESSLI
ncbi:MAG: ROK family protein [Melioribacteraceae bacterium]|nr:ROK family protein [Melioribacteraceae bacterium]